MKFIYTNVLAVFMVLCSSLVCNVYAQNDGPLLPSIPPSPEAAALGKYGQYPVAMYNGLVQIDIPIHTISLPKINIPVSISYHASGIKVDDISTPVGLGWVLNAGGVVTRSVKGRPDNNNTPLQGALSESFLNNLGSETDRIFRISEWNDRADMAIDTESDIYHYNVCGLTGCFRFDLNGNLIQIPLTNNLIETDRNLNYFQITGNDGTIYRFENKESSYITLFSSNISYTSSWYLSWIRTIDNREISFSYKADNTYYVSHFMSYWLTVSHNNPYIAHGGLSSKESYVQVNNTLMPETITFPGGSIQFLYNGDRADRRKFRLTSVNIRDGQNNLIKAYSLEHSYFTPSNVIPFSSAQNSGNYSANINYRLKLDKLNILDSRGNRISNYNFDYYTSSYLPAYLSQGVATYASGNNMLYFGQDQWGYYNGVTTNKNLFTYERYSTYNLNEQQANRDVNPNYAQACILNKITYPTKGYTEFVYEGNKGPNGENAGGLRIQRIISIPQSGGASVVKSYQYENGYSNQTGAKRVFGSAHTFPEIIITHTTLGDLKDVRFHDYYSSQSVLPLSHSGGASVFYYKVTEFDGEPTTCNGKTEYMFRFTSNSFDIQYKNLPIPHITNATFIPRFEYFFIERGWTRGQPTSTKVFKRNGSAFTTVKEIIYGYDIFKQQVANVGFNTFSNFNDISKPAPSPFGSATRANEYFQYTDLIAETGLVKPNRINEIDYYDNYNVTKSTTYSYDRLDNQFEVTSITQTNSDGSVIKKNYQYPMDINTGIYRTMGYMNILSPVITTTVSKNNSFLEESQVEYASMNNLIVPSALKTIRGTGSSGETDIAYLKYDSRGNPLHIVKNGVDNIVYLWSYNYNYLVAEIKGATYAQVLAAFGYSSDSQMEGFFSASSPDMNNMGAILRNSFRDSQVLVTVYSYKPLVGVTSVTDPSGVTTNYEYDDAGRLITVRDKDRRNVEEYIYNYKSN